MQFKKWEQSISDRFWAKVIYFGAAECWLWHIAGNGHYPMFKTPTGVRGAHVVSWCLYNKRFVPLGKLVRHSCDNKRCVNPAHLILGTVKDNFEDMRTRGGWSKPPVMCGENNVTSKLSNAAVIEIHTGVLSDEKYAEIFGVKRSYVREIRKGRRRLHG